MVLRWLAFASALALGCALPSASQADADIPVHNGLWGLELGVKPLSGSDTPIGIAAKHHVGDRTAIRLGFSGMARSSDGSDRASTEPGTHFDESRDDRDVTAFAHWMCYQGLNHNFGMTFEAGPTVHWKSAEYLQQITFSNPDSGAFQDMDVRSGDRNLWEYGLDLQVGFEWFFSPHVSLAARYGMAGLRMEARRTDESIQSSSAIGAMWHDYAASHSDGWVIRTTSPMVSLSASW